jgi:hypothetical protein
VIGVARVAGDPAEAAPEVGAPPLKQLEEVTFAHDEGAGYPPFAVAALRGCEDGVEVAIVAALP